MVDTCPACGAIAMVVPKDKCVRNEAGTSFTCLDRGQRKRGDEPSAASLAWPAEPLTEEEALAGRVIEAMAAGAAMAPDATEAFGYLCTAPTCTVLHPNPRGHALLKRLYWDREDKKADALRNELAAVEARIKARR